MPNGSLRGPWHHTSEMVLSSINGPYGVPVISWIADNNESGAIRDNQTITLSSNSGSFLGRSLSS